MEKKEYLNEENYNKSNKKVKVIGNILMIIGVILLVVGFIFIISGFLGFGNQFSSGIELGQEGINPKGIFSSFGGFALGGFMLVPGLFLTSVGFILRVLIGNRREITVMQLNKLYLLLKKVLKKLHQL